MQTTKKHWVVAGIGLVLAIIAIGIWAYASKAPTPAIPSLIASSTTPTDVATPSNDAPAVQTNIRSKPFSVDAQDTIASWDFKGAYTSNSALMQKADAEIARLAALLGTGVYTDYILYVSIANQYDLQGDGTNEFAYLQKALAIDSTQTGLAWYNAGQLFARLGAYETARTAFEGAVAAEPIPQYVRALADFNAEHPRGR